MVKPTSTKETETKKPPKELSLLIKKQHEKTLSNEETKFMETLRELARAKRMAMGKENWAKLPEDERKRVMADYMIEAYNEYVAGQSGKLLKE
jgi:hypothetical protein